MITMMIDDNYYDDCQVSHMLHAGPHQEIKLLHTIHTLKVDPEVAASPGPGPLASIELKPIVSHEH